MQVNTNLRLYLKNLNPSHHHKNYGMVACLECDFLHRIKSLPTGGKAFCVRCGSFLYKNIPNSVDKALALFIAAFILFILANVFPFVSLKLGGSIEENIMISGALAFFRYGMGELGVLVFITSFILPFLVITGMLYVLLPIKFGYHPWKMAKVLSTIQRIKTWNLLWVFMLGVLISYVKLLDIATVIPGVALFSFAVLLIVLTAAHANLDISQLWHEMELPPTTDRPGNTAVEREMIVCHACTLLIPKVDLDDSPRTKCPRCKSSIHSRKPNSISRTFALIVTAVILLIPANVFPVMTVVQLGQSKTNTILSGVIELIDEGMWVLAMIIFFASIVVPVLKIIVLSFLLISVKRKSSWRTKDRTLLYRVIEIVGLWSMVDIFAIATLIGLVNFGGMSSVIPGIGATFFASVVILTILATQSFDPRLIWDNSTRLK